MALPKYPDPTWSSTEEISALRKKGAKWAQPRHFDEKPGTRPEKQTKKDTEE